MFHTFIFKNIERTPYSVESKTPTELFKSDFFYFLISQGTLRVLLVLLHDFPEFLCDYYLSFCDVIPPTCVQLRNLILSAFPRSMRLPDPFTPNLKVRSNLKIGERVHIDSLFFLFFPLIHDSYQTNPPLPPPPPHFFICCLLLRSDITHYFYLFSFIFLFIYFFRLISSLKLLSHQEC